MKLVSICWKSSEDFISVVTFHEYARWGEWPFTFCFGLVDLVIQNIFNIKNKLGHYLHDVLNFGKGNMFSLAVIYTQSCWDINKFANVDFTATQTLNKYHCICLIPSSSSAWHMFTSVCVNLAQRKTHVSHDLSREEVQELAEDDRILVDLSWSFT